MLELRRTNDWQVIHIFNALNLIVRFHIYTEGLRSIYVNTINIICHNIPIKKCHKLVIVNFGLS